MRSHRLDALALVRLSVLVLVIMVAAITVLVAGVPDAHTLRSAFAGTGVLGVLGFVGLYAALTLTPAPASVLTIAAGAIFGVPTGITVVTVAATLSAVGAFYLGRLLGRDGVQSLASGRLDSFDRLVRRRGIAAVIVVRLVPLFPYAAVNYLAGLTAVRARDYTIGTIIGILPATAAYVAVGAYGSRPGSLPFLGALAALVLLSGAGVVAGGRRRRRTRQNQGSTAALGAASSRSSPHYAAIEVARRVTGEEGGSRAADRCWRRRTAPDR